MIDLRERDQGLVEKVVETGGPSALSLCFRCGACSGICPVEKVCDDFDPRVIVHAVLLGLKEKLLQGETIWYCSQCGSCIPVCPMDVKPMEVIKALQELAKEIGVQVEEKRFAAGRLARVEAEKCIVCLTCVRTCPFGAPYILEEGFAVIDPEKCQGCGICVVECPARAIVLEPSPENKVFSVGV